MRSLRGTHDYDDVRKTDHGASRDHLNSDGGAFYLTARLDVALPGLDREVAQGMIHSAHAICPYSKAVRGNIAV